MADNRELPTAMVDPAALIGELETAKSGPEEKIRRVEGIYPASVQRHEGGYLALARTTAGKRLVVLGGSPAAEAFRGRTAGGVKLLPLNAETAAALRQTFDWTRPVAIGDHRTSFGAGDRLGVATVGQLRALMACQVFPVLAQQSMREMSRTGRTKQQVIDEAGWGVFEAGYRGGFAADADHIKEIKDAVDSYRVGFSMFTIDSSDHIDKQAANLPDDEALRRFRELPEAGALRERFLGKRWEFSEEGVTVAVGFAEPALARAALTYGRAIAHMQRIYQALVEESRRQAQAFDLEVSVDETETDTTPEDHVFWAVELKARGVRWNSLAPKFTGEFQKGIDYRGDRQQFERQFAAHALLARKLGPYRISVHSGSDKFSIFPIIGKYTAGAFHLKTAGTSWLEAVRVIAAMNPILYRRMHVHALGSFAKDRASYHVTTDLGKVPALDRLKDGELPGLMDQIDSRQLLHITYGSLLSDRDEHENYLFRDEIYQTLYDHEETYYAYLDRHLSHHLETLGVKGR